MSFLTDVAAKIAVEAIEAVSEEAVKTVSDALSSADARQKEVEHVAVLGGAHD